MHTASNQRAQGGGKLCKFDKSQRFSPDGDGQIAIGKAGGQLFFGDLSAEGGVQGVDQRLAPLGESGPDNPKKRATRPRRTPAADPVFPDAPQRR